MNSLAPIHPVAPLALAVRPTVGVVIVSYNTSNVLGGCLDSLQSCALPLRTVVVDNHSHDSSAALVERYAPAVKLHVLPHNQGFAAANNIGLRWLGYGTPPPPAAPPDPPPYVLLLNPDTVVLPAAIETLVAFLHAHPRVGMVAPRLLNPDGSLQHGAFRFPTLSMSLLDMFPPGEVLPGRLYGSWWHGRYPQETRTPAAGAPFAIDHPLGACMLVRRDVLEEVGLLDAGYFLYSEEVDWCWRIRRAGWAIWQQPAARVIHIGGAATGQFRHRTLLELHRSRVRFFQQHYSPGFLRAHRAIVRAGMLRAGGQAWWAFLRGQMPRDELRARLWACAQVAAL